MINSLAKRKATNTGDKAGVTKGQQWVKIADGIELLDTPGISLPKFDSELVGYNLAVTGAIKDTILPKESVVRYALEFLYNNYKEELLARYKLDENISLDLDNIILEIGKNRNMLVKGGDINKEAVYTLILNELRNDIFCGFTYELPDDFIN